MSLENPATPNVFVPAPPPNTTKHTSEITRVSWNTQVAHIVASSSNCGTSIIWDLRQKKPWCELREANRSAISDIAWNPQEGMHIITASSDDQNPSIKLWDLRASTTMPLATLQGHSQGILGVSWCPHDPRLLVSCGKDNKTIIWDLFSLKAIDELANSDDGGGGGEPLGAESAFGGMGASQQKRFSVQWSPNCRGVLSTCSFDRKVQAHSVTGAGSNSGRAPKWLQRPSGVTTAFGGKVVKFSNSAQRQVVIDTVPESPSLVAASNRFESMMSAKSYKDLCSYKIETSRTPKERQVWGFMSLLFEPNAREMLVGHLGLNAAEIERQAREFEESASNGIPDLGSSQDLNTSPPMSAAASSAIKRSLLVGNFSAAVDCCFKSGQLADALVLASCGGADLWQKAQAEYFERSSSSRPFLKIVNAVINNTLPELVSTSDLSKWEETLAILSTYGKSEEFPGHCEMLGERLKDIGKDDESCICYMCALNIEKVSGRRSRRSKRGLVRAAAAIFRMRRSSILTSN